MAYTQSGTSHDLVVVGAGPAGLACAHELARMEPSSRILLVDVGRRHTRRVCPVDAGRSCVGCGGVCNVISGFGGCMHYRDGVKLSLMPSGRRLIDHYGPKAFELADDAFELMTEFTERPPLVGHEVEPKVLDVFAAHDLNLRQYPVAVLGETQLNRMIDGFWDRLAPLIDIRLNTAVTDVTPQAAGGYALTLRDRARTYQVHARNVVLATGRRGLVSTQRWLRALDIEMRPPEYSLGVRLEMRADYLRATGLSHPDMKVTQRAANSHKIKTFCFCGGANGGRIKFTHYQDAFGDPIITLDGHETLDRVAGHRPLAGNFGLLCQATALDHGVDESSPVVERELLAPYRAMNGGRPVVQTLADFRARRSPGRSWQEIEAALPFEPSVQDLVAAPVHALFNPEQHARLVDSFDSVMGPILALGGYGESPQDLDDEVLVVGLEIEFLWSRVSVSGTGETTWPGLYVTGDAAGLAQGTIQAAMMGLQAARAVAGAGVGTC